MSNFASKLKEELRALIPPALFFLIALHLVALVLVLMLKGTGISVGTSLTATISALIIAKAVLIADMLPIINLYPHKPLVYNVAWKTIIYLSVAMLIHYLERLTHFWHVAGSLVAGNKLMLADMVWPHFWAIEIFLIVIILMYCTMRELVRVIGGDEVKKLFFSAPQGGRSAA
jgi:hypothetical protein